MPEPTLGLAFLAGLLSFISPCVLPLVPAYIGYMGGRVTQTVAARSAVGVAQETTTRQRFVTFLHGIAFVAGFTFIFVVLGLLATAFVAQIGRSNVSLIEKLIGRVGGVIVIFFGLHIMGVMPALFRRFLGNTRLVSSPLSSVVFALLGGWLINWALVDPLLIMPALAIFVLWLIVGGAFTNPARFWTRTLGGLQRALYSEVRMQMTARGQQNFASSALMGIVFAAGWTPCIGPIYGAVLTLAANGGDVGQAGTLLAAYSLGLGVPFLLTALLLDNAKGALNRVKRHMHTVELVTGGFLVAIGVLVASGQLQALSATFATQFTDLSSRIEDCVIGVAKGEKALGELGPCLSGAEQVAAAPLAVSARPQTASPAPTTVAALNGPGSITGLAALGSSETGSAVYGTERGNLAQNFHVVTDMGMEMMLSDLRGRVVILNFWATWCGPCRTEMPEFDSASRRYGNQLAVVAVNNRETEAQMAAFREEVAVSFPFAFDQDGQIQDLFGIRQYPTTLVIDANGIIVERFVGPLDSDNLDRLVQTALT